MRSPTAMNLRKPIAASDLFVLLERAYRRQTRGCDACTFTLPFRVFPEGRDAADWAVVPANCSDRCRLILEDLVSEYRGLYVLR